MKNILLALLVVFVGSLSVGAQSGATFFRTRSDTNDTLGAYSTYTYDVNTLSFAGQNISKIWAYSIQIEADSISGSAADSSTVFVQVTASPVSDASPVWKTIHTDEIDGTATQIFRYTGLLYEPRMRIVIWSQSGTKAIALHTNASYKLYQKE